MIRAESVTARAGSLRLSSVNLTLGPGVHAILGGPSDGVPLLLALLAGRIRPRRGSVRLLELSPEDRRASTAYVPLDVRLPEALRVDEVLAFAATVRKEAATYATHRLGHLGLSALAERRVASLTRPETRAVAMAEALTSNARAIIVDEPFVLLDPRAAAVLAVRLREKAKDGACVVVGTASPRDASDLADDAFVLTGGSLTPVSLIEANLASRRGQARLHVRVSNTSAFLAKLSGDEAVSETHQDRLDVVVVGADGVRIAAAVARAVLESGVDLELLVPDAPTLPELQAASRATGTG